MRSLLFLLQLRFIFRVSSVKLDYNKQSAQLMSNLFNQYCAIIGHLVIVHKINVFRLLIVNTLTKWLIERQMSQLTLSN